MDIRKAYNIWAHLYDANKNRTRDLEALSLKLAFANQTFKNCLEIGCGTGKNTNWLITKADHITAVDFSKEMLSRARNKINSEKITFVQANINGDWNFVVDRRYDVVVFSLVLEHIKDLEPIFEKVASILTPTGCVYVGELHPIKQYLGTKARFETEEGLQEVECFTHHLTDYTNAAKKNGLELINLNEHFDDPQKETPPRILSLLFGRKE